MTNVPDYIPLIRRIARLYHTTFLEQADLEQEAYLALLEWESERECQLGVAARALERAATSDEAEMTDAEETDGAKTTEKGLSPFGSSDHIERMIHRAMQAAIRRYEHPENCSLQEMAETPEKPAVPGDIETLMEDAHLSERYKLVLTMHYGLDGGPAMSLRQIGRILGISPNTVNSILYQAAQKMKKIKKMQRGTNR